MTNCSRKCCLLLMLVVGGTSLVLAASQPQPQQQQQQISAAEKQVISALHAAAQDSQSAQPSEESYQRVYEAFTKLVQNVSNNSMANARRLVNRLNELVGGASPDAANAQSGQQSASRSGSNREQQSGASNTEEKTEQILTRLDQVNGNTDPRTLRQLQEDVNRLVGSLSDSYLRNIRRLIERVDRLVGRPSNGSRQGAVLHQSGDRFQDQEANRPPGFPGWDELINAVDRMQKSLASFVRSSTKLITSGRR